MARNVSALQTGGARTRGRGAARQGEAEGRTVRDQGTDVAAVEGPVRRGEEAEGQDHDDDDEDSNDDDASSSSDGEGSEAEGEDDRKPPARSQGAQRDKPNEDPDEGREGTADDMHVPRRGETRRREREPGGRPDSRARAERRTDRSASESARAAGDFGTPRNRERQANFAKASRISVSRMFISLGLSDEIVDAIVDEQGYNTAQALSRLDKKGVEQLVAAIRKPGGMKDGTRNPGINVPLRSQEIITGACFALKHQRRCGGNFHASLINLEILEELRLQQEIEDAHDNKEAYNTRPVWDSKKRAASADLIEQHFRQIRGRDGAPCAYLMREHVIPPSGSGSFLDRAESFDEQMIKLYPIIKPTELLSNLIVPGVEPPLKLYTREAAEDNAKCFQELKRIVQGTEAEVYVDEFNVHSEFRAAWRKLYNTFLGAGAKDTLAAQLEKTIQNLRYSGPKRGFNFATYVERHKDAYQNMVTLAKKTDYVAYDPSTRVRHFLNGITDPSLAQAKLSLEANREQYSGDFDACVEYLMNQVTHQQVNQQLNIASVDTGATVGAGRLKTKDARGNDLEMPLIQYTPEQWAQLSSQQKNSIRKRRRAQYIDQDGGRGGRERKRPRGGRGAGRGRGRGGRGHQGGGRGDDFKALLASVATLSNSVHVMAAASTGRSADAGNDDDAKPAAPDKMGSNARNSALTKNPKKEKE